MALSTTAVARTLHAELNGTSGGVLVAFTPPPYEADSPARTGTSGRRNPRFGDATVTFTLSQANALVNWMAQALRREVVEADLAVIVADVNLNAQLRVDLLRSVITAVEFSPLEAASAKAPVTVTLAIRAAEVRVSKGSGKVTGGIGKSKPPMRGNFRVSAAGIDGARVSRVALPTLTGVPAKGSASLARPVSGWSVGSLVIELSPAGYDAAAALIADIVGDGRLGDKEFTDVTVELLDAAMKNVLATFVATGCVVKGLTWSVGDRPTLEARVELVPATTELTTKDAPAQRRPSLRRGGVTSRQPRGRRRR